MKSLKNISVLGIKYAVGAVVDTTVFTTDEITKLIKDGVLKETDDVTKGTKGSSGSN